jgi:hypothetical membrane protein
MISKWFFIPLFLTILIVGIVNIYRGDSYLWYDAVCIIIGVIGLVSIVIGDYLEKRNDDKIKV